MPFPNIEDVIEGIVEQVFLDRQRLDGVYDYESLPKNFVQLALVSRNFLNPVRRNLYGHLKVEGPETFLILTGQLRFSPHLAKYVKSAQLNSSCTELKHIDGYEAGTPGDGEPRVVSRTAFRWFLEACPQLKNLDIRGGDFIWPLYMQNPATIKLTDISLNGCSFCHPSSPNSCTAVLGSTPGRRGGWLKSIVAFPYLKELEISELPLPDGPRDPTLEIPAGSSACTGLTICNINQPTSPRVLSTLLRSMSSLKELVLDGLRSIPLRELKKCLSIVAPSLTLLTLTDYDSQPGNPEPWDNTAVAALHQLKTLSFNNIPVTFPFFDALPPRLEHLRFGGVTLSFLLAPDLEKWLRRKRFPLRGILKKLQIVGELHSDVKNKASDAQVATTASLCEKLGIEWVYEPNPYGVREDEAYDGSSLFGPESDSDDDTHAFNHAVVGAF
ncbi:hypothetical protein FB45DRAFT_832488 [Roridomyces roridus]|uniref:Uncharacterized protein n=1 Tax=Roridomyces roridus TaxID=1738132 RepID=A0AAD7FN32_9AGAR|nr:hypothetical protein FB45DRAFT_832488 [Roridomyces roridus]